MRGGRTNRVGRVVLTLLAASSLEQAPAEPRDNQTTKRELRKRSAQVRSGTGLQSGMAAAIPKPLWPSDPANACANKQGAVTRAPTSERLALILEFKNLGIFPRFKDKIPFPLKSAANSFRLW